MPQKSTLLQKNANPAATAVNNAVNHDRDCDLDQFKTAAESILIPVEGTNALIDLTKANDDDLIGEQINVQIQDIKRPGEYQGYTVLKTGEIFLKVYFVTPVPTGPITPEGAYFSSSCIEILRKEWVSIGPTVMPLTEEPDRALPMRRDIPGFKIYQHGKQARKPMHDDSGATTGLRMQPDYGESDSYTSEMNEENSKGAAAGCVIAVEGGINTKEASVKTDMFVTALEYDPKQPMKVATFSFSPDRGQAMVFHRLTAEEVTKQINSPAFGAKARIVLAYNYEDMFKALEKLYPRIGPNVKQEIQWAKQKLKKQDRIVWYLRWYRLALTESVIFALGSSSWKTAPDYSQPTTPEQEQPQNLLGHNLEKLLQQYKREFAAKGGNVEAQVTIADFSGMKRTLEHFYSLPVPDIQNRVLTIETYNDVYEAFSISEQEWKDQAKRMLKPQQEDKVWMQFQDGWAWWWLPRAACDDESKAMGHCGNSPMSGKAGVSILSLRQSKKVGKETLWEPHLTFILHGEGESGVLGEMKGKNNDKPVSRYHPYIIALLKDDRIKGIAGGGYLPKNNFALADLTKEQRKEISKTNPNVGLTIKDYYSQYGMDEKLEQRIKTILELPSESRFESSYGFIIRSWKTTDDYIKDCGDSEAVAAHRYIKNGEHGHTEPDADELAELIDGLPDRSVYHIGLALQYNYAREMKDWYRGASGDLTFNPRDPEMVGQAIKDIYEFYIYQKIAERNKQDEGEVTKKKKPKIESLYQIPVIQEFWDAYSTAGPVQEEVEAQLDNKMQEAMGQENTAIEYSPAGILQIIEEEFAVQLAADAEAGGRSRHEFNKPTIDMPSDWDDWSQDRAKDNLRYYFEKPPDRPALKKQRRLFTEPKDEETAKRRGITVSKLLKSPLLRTAVKYEDVFTPWPDIWDTLGGNGRATALRSNAAEQAGIRLTYWQAWGYADTMFADLPPEIQEGLRKMTPHKGVRMVPRNKK